VLKAKIPVFATEILPHYLGTQAMTRMALAQFIDGVNNAQQKRKDEAVIQNRMKQNRKGYKENRSSAE